MATVGAGLGGRMYLALRGAECAVFCRLGCWGRVLSLRREVVPELGAVIIVWKSLKI